MTAIRIRPDTDATIDVDVQTTFMPGGGLPVAGGDEIVPVVQRVNALFPKKRRFATLDVHPLGHNSLASSYVGFKPYDRITAAHVLIPTVKLQPHAKFSVDELRQYLFAVGGQVLWPDHGIEGTAEAELHPALSAQDYAFILTKGRDPCCDSYSGFRDNLRRPTGFEGILKAAGVRRLFIKGLAYDFCVGWTAVDAKVAGFDEVFVIKDATRSVALPGTVEEMEEMFAATGVRIIAADQLS